MPRRSSVHIARCWLLKPVYYEGILFSQRGVVYLFCEEVDDGVFCSAGS